MRTTRLCSGLGSATLVALLLSAPVFGQVTERVSVSSSGAQGNAASASQSISADGQFAVFVSSATALVVGDTNGVPDVFVRDIQSGATERVSVATGGAQANAGSDSPSISSNGRFVAFLSGATNLVPGDTNGAVDAFVRDRQSGTTELVSVSTGGAQANAELSFVSISGDGRFVTFQTGASNLVAGDTNGAIDVFVRDRQNGITERVSVSSAGAQGNSTSGGPSISEDGRFVLFTSDASNLVPGDTNGVVDVFMRDRQSGTTERVSVSSAGVQGDSTSDHASISSDGRFVAFEGTASNLVAGDTNAARDVFLRDRQNGTTERLSVSAGGTQGGLDSENPSISADGRFVVFQSAASNLVSGDTNGVEDVFLRDRGCPLASASFRNAGSNPASYTCNAPVLGTNWSGTVDLSTTGHSSAYVYAFATQTTSTLTQGQVLLGSGQIARFGPVAGPLATFSFPVPISTALCGLHLTTQALHLGAVSPFATSNAMDLVVGQ